MTRTASMPQTRAGGLRKLFLILSIELAFVMCLHALGSMERMRIDFGNFSKWLDVTSPEVALTASIRMLALVIAYWVLLTSAIYLIARTFKIPGMLKLMEITTLPFVRKAIDGALAAAIISGTVFGGASAVFAKQDASKVQAGASATSTIKDYRHLYNPVAAEDTTQVKIDTPSSSNTLDEVPVIASAPIINASTSGAAQNLTTNDNVPVPAEDVANNVKVDDTSKSAPAIAEESSSTTSTSTTVPKVVVPQSPSTEVPVVPTTPKTTVPNTTPTPQPVPSPGVIVEGERIQKNNDTQTPTETPVAAVAGSYTVVSGDNFWNIAKAQVQQTLGRAPSNSEVANYWVKLIDANKGNIRSGDADLIFPGEVFTIPTI